MNFPASGFGDQSQYYDENLLLNGTYQITSVTVHSSSRDETNAEDTEILRPGLLLVKSVTYDGFYEPLDTSDGCLNGDIPTQFMRDVLILGRKEFITKDFILGNRLERTISPANRVVPAYIMATVFSNKIYYNNSDNVEITDLQWESCQRIKVVLPSMNKYDKTETLPRALLWNREETIVTPQDLL